ncbi:hypothetical protein NIES4072_13840 [Nostoc commune NIES-4072]|uniref:Uncharacterized protein n=1 Tax=Nostoc commune NIES-4072 TaxID=2005467 RepID=A0A2R5FN87_NOSCO|nr:hypothetical protein NIES4070_12980 [Nostoc commune HK-02]GBG17723.1 hypothetical protein NIES4072_13840 [Nostoc commune NIES-4072]
MLNYKIPKKWLILVTVALISALLLAIASTASSIYLYGSSTNNIKAGLKSSCSLLLPSLQARTCINSFETF